MKIFVFILVLFVPTTLMADLTIRISNTGEDSHGKCIVEMVGDGPSQSIGQISSEEVMEFLFFEPFGAGRFTLSPAPTMGGEELGDLRLFSLPVADLMHNEIFFDESFNVPEGDLSELNGVYYFPREQLGDLQFREHTFTLGFFDPINFILQPNDVALPGDANLDGVVDFFDISEFVNRLMSSQYQSQADANGDEQLDFADILPFIAALSGMN